MIKEQIKDFNKAYRKIKRFGFENYFCAINTTWKKTYENFKKGMTIQDEISVCRLQEIVKVVLTLDKKNLALCKSCGNIFSSQEFRAGFENCEHCDGHCGCKSVLKELEVVR